jgi:hypothetical protein
LVVVLERTSNCKCQYRDLSATAAKAPPPVEMTGFGGGFRENKQLQLPIQGSLRYDGKSAASGRDDRQSLRLN